MPMAVFDGASIGIGMESVSLAVAFVGNAIFPLDFEKKVLHFPERTPVNGGSKFFDCAGEFWLGPSPHAGKEIRVALHCEKLPLGSDGRFEIANRLVGLLQTDRLGSLRVS